MPGLVPKVIIGSSVLGVDEFFAVERCAFVGGQLLPARDGLHPNPRPSARTGGRARY
jgi:hypothetical protein